MSYGGKIVVHAGDEIRSSYDDDHHAQGREWVLPNIFAPFEAEHELGLEYGSLWDEWMEGMRRQLALLTERYSSQGDLKSGQTVAGADGNQEPETRRSRMSGSFEVGNDDVVEVAWGDPKLMGFCSVCEATPCKAENEYFGTCPICHRNHGCVNLVNESGTWADQYMVCDTHKTCWCFGGNLLTGWIHETPETREASRKKLEMYRVVHPYQGFMDFADDDRNQHHIDTVNAETVEPDTSDDCG